MTDILKEVSNYFEKKFLEWQNQKGRIVEMQDFADYLGISKQLLSHYMLGRQKPSAKTALKISDILDDYFLLDLLGLARPGKTISIDQLPKDFQERLKSALDEVEETLKGREVSELEAAEISREIFEKHGFSANFTITE